MDLSWVQSCGQIVTGKGPLLIALFLAGLGGSVTHCLTMCSVFVLGQSQSVANKGRLARLLLPYHAGRITTYVVLGAVAGVSFHLIAGWSGFAILRHFMLALVATIFLSVFAQRLLNRFGVSLPFRLGLTTLGGCALRGLNTLKSTTGGLRRYALGLSLGLLPCPLVFAALLAVAASADPLIGAAGMLAFGMGTLPALVGLAFASGNLLNKSPRVQDGLTLAALGINGVILLTLAVA